MEMNKPVLVKSTVKAQVGINVPYLNLKRTWPKKNSVQRVQRDLLMQAIYEPGVEYLFKTGILIVEDEQDRIDLGLQDPETGETVYVLTDEMCKHLIQEADINEFKLELEKMSHDQVIELANTAIELESTSYEKNLALREASEINVDAIVRNNKEEQRRAQMQKAVQ